MTKSSSYLNAPVLRIQLPERSPSNAPINVNPVGGAGKGSGFDAWDYPRCRAFDRVK